jgi:glycosyltransferase involved in cell wall biosynthesis
MAWSVPVISSNSGGLPSKFDGISGYLSDVGNIDEMAENALKIITDVETFKTFKANVLSVAKQFIKNILPIYEDIYQQAIQPVHENI